MRFATVMLASLLLVGSATAGETAQKTISEAMAANPRLSKWVAILKELKLWELLQATPPVTAFAPTNEALEEIPDASWQALRKNNEEYRRLVLFHFLKGARSTHDFLKKGGHYRTLAGLDIDVKIDGKGLVLWDGTHTANVLTREVKAKNGVLHLIDAVAQPPAPKM